MNSANPDERPRAKVGPSPLTIWALALFGLAPSSAFATTTASASVGNPAAALFASDPTSPLALGMSRLEQADPAAALAALKGYSGAAPEAAMWLSARAHEALGQKDQALALIAGLPKRNLGCAVAADDPLSIEPAVLAAKILAPSQPLEAARRLLELPADGARFSAALALLAKDPVKLEAAELRFLKELPADPASLLLAERLGLDALRRRLSFADRRTRVSRLLEAHANDAAKKEATALLTEPEVDESIRCELLYVLGKAERKLRSYKPAIDTLTEARKVCPSGSELAIKSALLELQVRAIRGQVRASKPTLDWILQRYAEHSYADDAIYTYAEIADRSGLPKIAIPLYEQILSRYPSGDQVNMAAWRLALRAIEAGDKAEAIKRLRSITTSSSPGTIDSDGARYWLAQLSIDTAPKEAEAHFMALAEAPSFYTWLAIDRLSRTNPAWAEAMKKRLLEGTRSGGETAPLSTGITSLAAFVKARALFAGGLPELAAAELETIACAPLDDAGLLTIALAFDAVGAHARAQAILRSRPKLWSGPFRPEILPVLRATYSRAYAGPIESAARAERVEPLFLTALVREESTFDPEIVSWAGATGLAQLMPPTAIGAYATVFRGRLDLARLTEPELNLRLGAHVLRLGMKSFEREPLALGAYNGGGALVERALGTEQVAFDLWIERFAVKETRRYIKRVTETWGIYRLLYDKERPFITLPETVGPKAAPRD